MPSSELILSLMSLLNLNVGTRRSSMRTVSPGFASAGVACRASLAGLAGERAETANFNSIAFDKLLAEEVEELFDNNFNIIAHKSGGFGDFLNKRLFSYISHALNISLT